MKIIYYAIKQTLEVPDNATEAEIDDLIFQQLVAQVEEPTDYIWSEKSDLFFD